MRKKTSLLSLLAHTAPKIQTTVAPFKFHAHTHTLGAATATHKNTRKFVKLKPRAIIYWY